MAVSNPVRVSMNASATTGVRQQRRARIARRPASAHPATKMAQPFDASLRRIQLVNPTDSADVSIGPVSEGLACAKATAGAPVTEATAR
jgi:hypothetical protein